MSPLQLNEEIETAERVIPRLTNLGDVAIQQRRLAALMASRAAAGHSVAAQTASTWVCACGSVNAKGQPCTNAGGR
jgi:hypothetical protein